MIIPTMMVTCFIIAVYIERVTNSNCNRCVVVIQAILAGVMEWTR